MNNKKQHIMSTKEIKLGFGNVEAANSDYKERIQPGITDCEIKEVSVEENVNKKQYIAVKLENTAGTLEHTEQLYITTENALKNATERLKHLYQKTTGKNAPDSLTVKGLDKALKSKSVRIKFVGEEYEYNGDVKVKSSFAYKGFAEPIGVAKEDSALRFNPDNKWDFKRLEKVENNVPDYSSDTALGSSPFDQAIDGDDPF